MSGCASGLFPIARGCPDGRSSVIDFSLPSLADLPDPTDERALVSGTALAVARALRVSPLAVRAAFVATTFASGLGLLAYFLCWIVLVRPPTAAAHRNDAASITPDAGRTIGFGVLVLAVMVLAVRAGLAQLGTTWAVCLVGAGVVFAWGGTPGIDRSASADEPGVRPAHQLLRQLLGALLVVAGLLIVVGDRLSWSLLVDGSVIGGVVVVGCALVLGPWMLRTSNTAIDERRDRVRSEEREAVAAHLHDSVLQTLTLIQRRAADPEADPRVVAALARRQERELRRWLYGRSDTWQPGARLKDALESTAADIEDLHGVTVEAVIVGDAAMGDHARALVGATREALVNSAKFSQRSEVSLFAEVTPSGIDVFVRDRGVGFDLSTVPADRRGVRDSIDARIARAGGRSTISSRPGEGTEIELWVPRDPHESKEPT